MHSSRDYSELTCWSACQIVSVSLTLDAIETDAKHAARQRL